MSTIFKDQMFLFYSTLKTSFHCLWPPFGSDEANCRSCPCSLYMMYLYLVAFNISSWSAVFRSLTEICSAWCVCLYLSCLGFTELLGSLGFSFKTRWWSWSIISSNIFSPQSLSSPSDSPVTHLLDCLVWPHSHWHATHLLKIFIFLSVLLIGQYLLILFNSLILFSVGSKC